MRRLLPLFLMLAACGGDDKPRHQSTSGEWSVGAPDGHPSGPVIDLAAGTTNYVTKATGSLGGKHRITLRYSIDMAEGVRIYPPSMPDGPSIITLYFQRKGDDWSGAGKFETYRWYATSASQSPITAGEHEITATLDSGTPNADPTQLGTSTWTAIQASSSYLDGNFQSAKDNAARVGFVLGGGTGYGHGVKASGPATLTIISFTVQ